MDRFDCTSLGLLYTQALKRSLVSYTLANLLAASDLFTAPSPARRPAAPAQNSASSSNLQTCIQAACTKTPPTSELPTRSATSVGRERTSMLGWRTSARSWSRTHIQTACLESAPTP